MNKIPPVKIRPTHRGPYLILDNIRSLHNVGSMFRTADALGVAKIYLCGYTGRPIDLLGRPAREIAKTALGAERAVPWEHAKHAWRVVEELKRNGVRVIALENNVPGAIPLEKCKPAYPFALIVGNEMLWSPFRCAAPKNLLTYRLPAEWRSGDCASTGNGWKDFTPLNNTL